RADDGDDGGGGSPLIGAAYRRADLDSGQGAGRGPARQEPPDLGPGPEDLAGCDCPGSSSVRAVRACRAGEMTLVVTGPIRADSGNSRHAWTAPEANPGPFASKSLIPAVTGAWGTIRGRGILRSE